MTFFVHFLFFCHVDRNQSPSLQQSENRIHHQYQERYVDSKIPISKRDLTRGTAQISSALCISQMHDSTTEDQVRTSFKRYGSVESIDLKRNHTVSRKHMRGKERNVGIMI
jgi:hypothetical protein